MSTLPTPQEELELRRLAGDYAAAVDGRDPAALVELFLPDGELSVQRGGELVDSYHGRGEIPNLFERLAGCEATLHEVASHRLWFDGAVADGEVRCVAHHVSRDGEEARDLVLAGHYLDRYAREGDRWRFASRRFVVEWTELRPVRLP